MNDAIELISDGNGLAVIGDPAAVERFLAAEGLPSKDLGLQRLGPAFATAAVAVQAGSTISATSSRWVKLTEESAQLVKKYGLMESKTPGVSHAMVGKPGSITSWIQIDKAGSLLTNPAILTGAAGIMAQYSMQQSMEEITEYLAIIDEKVDDLLRAQKDSVLADMIGVDFVIEEAMTIREHVGRVSEVTWSKVQSTSVTVARTQAYALRQLDALTEKVERKSQISDLAKVASEVESKVPEWLAVLARCFQLLDAIAVLELDRVLDASPEELDRHRLALIAARRNRLELISRSTAQLIARMNAAAGSANAKVLLHPVSARSVVESSNHVAIGVHDLRGLLGIESSRESLDAKRWMEAVTEMKDRAIETGTGGVDAAVRRSGETLDRATGVFRSVDLDGDGVPDKPRARAAVEDAGSAIKGATAGATGAVGSFFRRKRDERGPADARDSTADEPEEI